MRLCHQEILIRASAICVMLIPRPLTQIVPFYVLRFSVYLKKSSFHCFKTDFSEYLISTLKIPIPTPYMDSGETLIHLHLSPLIAPIQGCVTPVLPCKYLGGICVIRKSLLQPDLRGISFQHCFKPRVASSTMPPCPSGRQ